MPSVYARLALAAVLLGAASAPCQSARRPLPLTAVSLDHALFAERFDDVATSKCRYRRISRVGATCSSRPGS